MTTPGRRLGRIVVGLATIAAAFVAGEVPAGSEEATTRAIADVPVVSIDPELAFVATEIYRDCDDTEYDTGAYGVVVLERTGDPDADIELEVPVTYGGTLAGSLIDQQPAAVFEPGWPEAEVFFQLPDSTPGTITVTLDAPLDAAGYELPSDPEQATIELTVPGEEIVLDCDDPLELDEEFTDQTIEVGERPEPLGIFDFGECDDDDDCGFGECDVDDDCEIVDCEGDDCDFEATATTAPRAASRAALDDDDFDLWDLYSLPVVGALPPGLTYADDEWGGAATTPGVYEFHVRLCLDIGTDLFGDDMSLEARALQRAARAIEDLPETLCFGTEGVRIEVLAATIGTTVPSAPPATPISGRARFTG